MNIVKLININTMKIPSKELRREIIKALIHGINVVKEKHSIHFTKKQIDTYCKNYLDSFSAFPENLWNYKFGRVLENKYKTYYIYNLDPSLAFTKVILLKPNQIAFNLEKKEFAEDYILENLHELFNISVGSSSFSITNKIITDAPLQTLVNDFLPNGAWFSFININETFLSRDTNILDWRVFNEK